MKPIFINMCAVLCLTANVANAAKPIEDVLIAAKVPYVTGAGEAEKMTEASCDWGVQIAKDLVKETKNKAKFSDQDLSSFSGRKLFLFVNNSDDGSEASSKAVKWLGVLGQLYDQNILIGDFFFTDSMYKGSLKDCKNVKYASSGLASSIATWLEAPRRVTAWVAPTMLAVQDAIDSTVAADCQWETRIPENMLTIANGTIAYLPMNNLDTSLRVIKLTLTDSRFMAGGFLSGPKYMEISGELFEKGVKVSHFKAHGSSARGWSSCSAMSGITYALANDIVKWLKDPKPGVNLEDL